MNLQCTTEMRNPVSFRIDTKSTTEILQIINDEDKKVPYAVEQALPAIGNTVEAVIKAFRQGGRLVYIGAGTSGRLGVLDASECPPTFGVPHSMVQGIIAGGNPALTTSIEGSEDDGGAGVQACKDIGFTCKDVLVGITANGGAPFVVAALKYARSLGASTAAISCNAMNPAFDVVDKSYRIYLPVGPEIVTGSTRMKSGTAQKLVLNMITTTAMIRIGKVYNNYMVDLMPVNTKLITRSVHMIGEIANCSEARAREVFEQSGHETKTSIVMACMDCDAPFARRMLEQNGGSINKVLDTQQR